MTQRLIPNGDLDFSDKASQLARGIAADPARFGLADEDAREMGAAAEGFRRAYLACRTAGRSGVATRAKDTARAECERVYRRCVARIRISEDLDAGVLLTLGLRPPKEKRQARRVPLEPPSLTFVRALHEGNATPVHELDFRARDLSAPKPPGAQRLELFVDLIPPDEPIPAHPGANWGGRPWYLRSYTRSPIRLVPPMARVPMRVVYWGRWADATGNVGPFSATAVAWIEGGSHHGLPGAPEMRFGMGQPAPLLPEGRDPGPDTRQRTYVVAVMEAQYESFSPTMNPSPARALPEPQGELRQLEGPPEEHGQDRDAA